MKCFRIPALIRAFLTLITPPALAEPAAVQQQDVLGVLLSLDQQAYGGDDAIVANLSARNTGTRAIRTSILGRADLECFAV